MLKKIERQIKSIKFGMKYFGFLSVLWYRITMFFTKRHGTPVVVMTDIKHIPEALKFGDDYKPDPKHFDNMSHPRKVQRMLDTGIIKHFDCEDHAGYWISVINKSKLAPITYLGIIMYVYQGKVAGHAVCVYQDDNGNYWWGDYTYPEQVDGRWAWAGKAAAKYGAEPFAAALVEINGINSVDTPRLGKYHYRNFS